MSGRFAQPGTLLFRRNDVMHRLHKLISISVRNMRLAEAEDNQEWREGELTKVRILTHLKTEIEAKCPAFASEKIVNEVQPATEQPATEQPA